MQTYSLLDTRARASHLTFDLIWLSLFLFALFFIFLGERPLFSPDEGRYAEIAREMLVSHDFITPYLNGIKYFEKPPLFYWLAAVALKFGGVNIFAVRTVNAILGIFLCLATYLTANQLYNRRTGILAAIILATSPLFFAMSHTVSLDLPLTVFLTITFYAFLLSIHARTYIACKRYLYLAASTAALAFLTKGLIGVVFPVLIIFPYLFFSFPRLPYRGKDIVVALILFLALTLPWHILVQMKNPEFFYFYFINQQFLRYSAIGIGHYKPNWYFIPCLFVGFFPWIIFLFIAFFSQKKPAKYGYFLLLWTSVIFIFFSLSKSKLIPYILPVIPPLALYVGLFFDLMMRSQKRLALFFALLILVMSGVLVNCIHMATKFDNRTVLPLATIINEYRQEAPEVITYNQYYQDLPFYLGETVTVLNWQGELKFGLAHQPQARTWMIVNHTLMQKLHNNNRFFILMDKKSFATFLTQFPQGKYVIIAQDGNHILLRNQTS